MVLQKKSMATLKKNIVKIEHNEGKGQMATDNGVQNVKCEFPFHYQSGLGISLQNVYIQ